MLGGVWVAIFKGVLLSRGHYYSVSTVIMYGGQWPNTCREGRTKSCTHHNYELSLYRLS